MYMSAKEAAEKWGISERRVRILCAEGRVDGVLRTSWAWNIPSDTLKPTDGRQLRHMKNHDLRIGGMDFTRLDTEAEKLTHLEHTPVFMQSYSHLVGRYVLSFFACDDIIIRPKNLHCSAANALSMTCSLRYSCLPSIFVQRSFISLTKLVLVQ